MQQVNLYTAEFRPIHIILPFRQLVSGSLAMALLLAVASVFLTHKQSVQSKNLAQLQANTTAMQEQVQKQRDHLAALKPDPFLLAKRDQVQHKLDQGRHLVTEFEALSVGELKLFSPYFIGLARHTRQNIWLSHITLEGASRYIRLEGNALSAQAVPDYLARLKGEAVFSGSRFASFNVDTQADTANGFAFVLESATRPGATQTKAGGESSRITSIVAGG